MLRFDLPRVPAHVIRFEAFVTHVLCWLSLLVSPWFLVVPLAQGAVRGFLGHRYCPAHLLWRRLFEAAGGAGRLEDAGPKMFANKVLFIASGAALALYLAGSELWQVPCVVLITFSFLEWGLSFCAACWVYSAWYKRFPAAG
ncbi:MAG TPA: DUF4395 family protein [Ramlibacter sp.]|nr:DUF4395 family protein [Ramlibacter sp.]